MSFQDPILDTILCLVIMSPEFPIGCQFLRYLLLLMLLIGCVCVCVCVLIFICLAARGIFVSQPGVKPTCPALQDGSLTTEPLRNPLIVLIVLDGPKDDWSGVFRVSLC